MTSSTARRPVRLLAALFVGAALLLSGCAASGGPKTVAVPPEILQDYLKDKPAPLQGLYTKVLQEGKRNFVLNQLQAGLAAMSIGAYEQAKQSFDEALDNIEAVYANNEEAQKARSLWHEEGAKDFKGEPYERAMAYYYRGILYLMDADYENARACFKAGMLQDAFVEEDQHQFDFALLAFLEGWASQQNGDHALAEESYAEVKKWRPDFVLPDPEDDTLVLIETGRSPRKVSDGVGHAELKYRRGKKFKEERALVRFGDTESLAYPMEDIFFQARTRGGRPVDKILEGKAVFLQTGLGVGTALTELSSTVVLANTLLGNSGTTANVGAVIGGVGGIVTLVAINAKPHADTRYWDNLPDMVHVMTRKQDGSTGGEVVFAAKDLAPLEMRPREFTVINDKNGKGLVWVRSRRALRN